MLIIPVQGKRRQEDPGCPLASQAGQLGAAVLFRDSVTENRVGAKAEDAQCCRLWLLHVDVRVSLSAHKVKKLRKYNKTRETPIYFVYIAIHEIKYKNI